MNNGKILLNAIPTDEVSEVIQDMDAISSKVNITPDDAEHGLAKLVLTLIEVIRKLVEKQAMRRVEGGTLTDDEIEKLGESLMKLEIKMNELKLFFKLNDEDLKINLGPLGSLM